MGNSDNPSIYFKHYRNTLGFRSKDEAKTFLAAKNVIASIDYKYIHNLNQRIHEIVERLNSILNPSEQYEKGPFKTFLEEKIDIPFDLIQTNEILPRLNNQGRRPEEVLFSWLRGYAISEFFLPVLVKLFQCNQEDVVRIGGDDFTSLETFRRTPNADIEIKYKDVPLRIEVQSGFQGVNDIKEHKVREARRIYQDKSVATACAHFDIFNGQAALVRLDTIKDDDVNWVTRQQMEGQTVLTIEQNCFCWRFLEPLPDLNTIEVELG